MSLLPHCKTFGGVLRLPSYCVPSPTTSGVYCGLVDGTAQIMHTTVLNFSSPLLATPSITFTTTLGIDAYGARIMGPGLTHKRCRRRPVLAHPTIVEPSFELFKHRPLPDVPQLEIPLTLTSLIGLAQSNPATRGSIGIPTRYRHFTLTLRKGKLPKLHRQSWSPRTRRSARFHKPPYPKRERICAPWSLRGCWVTYFAWFYLDVGCRRVQISPSMRRGHVYQKKLDT